MLHKNLGFNLVRLRQNAGIAKAMTSIFNEEITNIKTEFV